MKKLQITSEHYKALLEAYNNWLETLDYAPKTQNTWATHVKRAFTLARTKPNSSYHKHTSTPCRKIQELFRNKTKPNQKRRD